MSPKSLEMHNICKRTDYVIGSMNKTAQTSVVFTFIQRRERIRIHLLDGSLKQLP